MEIKLTQGRLIMAIAGAIAIAMLLIYFIIYAPLIKRLNANYREYRSYDEEVLKVHNTIETASRTHDGKGLIAEEDVSFAIDELTKYGKSIGINFISMRPGEIIADKEAKYKILPIEMEIESNNEQFSEFLGSLDEFKRSLIKIKSFELASNTEDRAKLKAKITVYMYLSLGL